MGAKLKALLIEDEPLITFLFEDILAETEFEITAVMTCSGPVLRHLDSDVPDVAVVDLVLEDGPCIRVIERLLELRVPTVIVSGHEDAEQFATRDGAIVVAKPFRSEALLSVLRSMVQVPPQEGDDGNTAAMQPCIHERAEARGWNSPEQCPASGQHPASG